MINNQHLDSIRFRDDNVKEVVRVMINNLHPYVQDQKGKVNFQNALLRIADLCPNDKRSIMLALDQKTFNQPKEASGRPVKDASSLFHGAKAVHTIESDCPDCPENRSAASTDKGRGSFMVPQKLRNPMQKKEDPPVIGPSDEVEEVLVCGLDSYNKAIDFYLGPGMDINKLEEAQRLEVLDAVIIDINIYHPDYVLALENGTLKDHIDLLVALNIQKEEGAGIYFDSTPILASDSPDSVLKVFNLDESSSIEDAAPLFKLAESMNLDWKGMNVSSAAKAVFIQLKAEHLVKSLDDDTLAQCQTDEDVFNFFGMGNSGEFDPLIAQAAMELFVAKYQLDTPEDGDYLDNMATAILQHLHPITETPKKESVHLCESVDEIIEWFGPVSEGELRMSLIAQLNMYNVSFGNTKDVKKLAAKLLHAYQNPGE